MKQGVHPIDVAPFVSQKIKMLYINCALPLQY